MGGCGARCHKGFFLDSVEVSTPSLREVTCARRARRARHLHRSYDYGLTDQCGKCFEVMCVDGKQRGTPSSVLGPWKARRGGAAGAEPRQQVLSERRRDDGSS